MRRATDLECPLQTEPVLGRPCWLCEMYSVCWPTVAETRPATEHTNAVASADGGGCEHGD